MEWLLMTKKDAGSQTAQWNALDKPSFEKRMEEWGLNIDRILNADYKKLRKDVSSQFVETKKLVKNPDYSFDLEFGIRFYYLINSYGFSVRQASIDGIWRFLCVRVFPDIVAYRFFLGNRVRLIKKEGGGLSQNVREDRYWSTARRVYLKALWWYIHLSLQEGTSLEETKRKTKEALRNCTTDTIVQTVERAGSSGYRVELNRAIIKYYAKCQVFGTERERLLRRVMVYNTARCVLVEPALMNGGIDAYVKYIFMHCGG